MAISGAAGTTIDGVEVEGASIKVGADGITSIRNASTLDASGDIAVNGDSVAIADSSVESVMGKVEITADTTIATLSNTKVSGENATVEGVETSITGGSVTAEQMATITGATRGTLSDTLVMADDVTLNGGDITVKDDSSIEATNGDIIGNLGSLTIGTAGETVTEDTMTAKKNIDITVSGATTIQGAAQLVAKGGDVSINGADTSANAITGEHTLVDSDAGSVSISGDSNTVSDQAVVSADKDITISGDTANTIEGVAQVETDNGSVKIAGGDTAANTISGIGATGVDKDTLVSAYKEIDIDGATNTIKDGADVLAGTDVTMVAATANTIKGGATVTSKTGYVVVDGDTTAANIITDEGSLVDAATSVYVEGKTNEVSDGANVLAGTNASLVAAESNTVTGEGTKVDAEGSIGMSAVENTIEDKAALVAGTNVSIIGSGSNTVQGGATVTSKTGYVVVDGDTTAANIITDEGSLVDAATSVYVEGKTNEVSDGANVLAGTNASLVAAESNTVIGEGTKVDAEGSIGMSAVENTIEDKAALAAGTNVSIIGSGSNTIKGGSEVTAETGVVAITGPTNKIDGDGTTVTGETSVVITGASANTISGNAQVAANTESVTIDGGTMATNTIKGSDTLVGAATDVDIDGAVNIIKEGADVRAGADVTLDAATSNTIQGDATVTAEGGYVNISAGTNNDILSGADVKAAVSVNVTGPTNTITGADAANPTTVTAVAGNVTIKGETANTIGDNATVQSLGAAVMVKGGATADNTITGTKAQVSAATSVYVEGKTNEVSAGADILAGTNASLVAAESNTVIGEGTKVDAEGSIGMSAVENTIEDKAALAAGTNVTINATMASNTITGAATIDAGGYIDMDAVVDNGIDSASKLTALGDVTLSAGDDNYITGVDTQLYAGGAVSLDGKNNTITDTAKMIGLEGVNAEAEENNMITDGGKAFALNDNASVILTAGKVNQIAGASTVVYARNDTRMTAVKVNVIDAAKLTAMNGSLTMANAAGSVDTLVNSIQNGAQVAAGTDVAMTGDKNTIVQSSATAIGGSVTLTGATQNAISESTVKAGTDVTLTGDKNAILTGSIVTATDKVTMTGATQNAISASTVKAGNDVTLTGDQGTVDNVIIGGTVSAGEAVAMIGENNTITAASTAASAVNAGTDVTLDAGVNNVVNEGSMVTAKGSVDMDAVENNIISDIDTQVYAVDTVSIDGENNVITEKAKVIGLQEGVEITAGADNTIYGGAQVLGYNDDASVSISAGEDNLIAGATTKVYAGSDVDLTAATTNTVYAATVTAKTGDITMGNTADNTDIVVNTVTAAGKLAAAYDVKLTGDKNAILAGSTVTAGMDVTLTADTQNAVANSAVTAKHGDITMGDVDGSVATVENVITSEAGKTATLTAGKNVTIAGDNIITAKDKGSTSITATSGNVTIHDSNYIKYAVINAWGEGDVSITTGTGDKITWIEDSSISGETVTIKGDITDRSTENLAVVKGADTLIKSLGEDDGTGITLNNVYMLDTEDGVVAWNGGDINILNRVDAENGTLTIADGTASDARIVVDAGNVLNTREASSLEGRLTGTGDINKSGGDDLLLNYDHTEFNGTIYANGAVGGADGSVLDGDNAGSWIQITDNPNMGAGQKAGVGRGASIVLKNTDLVISTTEARIGTLDTTQDIEQNNAATGDTLLADGSYTTDDNLRADFTTVGSVLEVNKDNVGDSVKSSNLKLSDATLIKLDAAVAADGSASSDKIEALGTIDVAARAGLNSTSTAAAPSTARVYIRHYDNDLAATAAEGARTTIMTGNMATDINEDVLYDVEVSGNGTYQRKLLDRNVHLENKGDRVDLVYSKNYRSCDKAPQMQQVANALKQISDTFHHHEGTLAASSNRLHNLIDAFDYTRSEGAAQRGLQSVAGAANVLPGLMLFDSSRRHLDNLRRQIAMPVCPAAAGGSSETRRHSVWMSYSGASDELGGGSSMGDYSRTSSEAMVGIDRSLSCKWRVGASLGCEESTGELSEARVDAETLFVDAYAAGITGRYKHRASVGMAFSSFDSSRFVLVEAGYHTFRGVGKGSTDSLTLNFGYEISTDIQLSDRSFLTPYAAINLSWHKLDAMRESGLGEAGLVSRFDTEWQSEIILGMSYNRQFTALRSQAPALFYAGAAVHFELLADRVGINNRFLGAAPSWNMESMKRQQLFLELGTGVVIPLSPSWTASAGAAIEIGSDRSGVSGNVSVRYQF